MLPVMNVLTIVVLLCPSALADDCASSSGSCVLGQKERDETSFVQLQQVLKRGEDRSSLQESTHSTHSKAKKGGQSVTKEVVPVATPVFQKDDKTVPVEGNATATPDVSEEVVPVETPVFQKDDKTVLVEGNATATLHQRLINEIEFEFGGNNTHGLPTMNKFTIVIVEFFFGCCGVDRCCMGQPLLGVIKCVTFGGLFIWWQIDAWVIMINAVASSPSIDCLGFVASWSPDSITPAFIVGVIWLAIMIIGVIQRACVAVIHGPEALNPYHDRDASSSSPAAR